MRKQAAPINSSVEEHRKKEGESNAADTNETVRYPLRERRQPEYLKDYVIGDDVNKTLLFTLAQLPKGKNIIGGRWVYTVKQSGSHETAYKARYVAKGHRQTKDIDYYETYAPTTKMTSVRVLMQLAAQKDYIVHQMDVKAAYLTAPIDCDI